MRVEVVSPSIFLIIWSPLRKPAFSAGESLRIAADRLHGEPEPEIDEVSWRAPSARIVSSGRPCSPDDAIGWRSM